MSVSAGTVIAFVLDLHHEKHNEIRVRAEFGGPRKITLQTGAWCLQQEFIEDTLKSDHYANLNELKLCQYVKRWASRTRLKLLVHATSQNFRKCALCWHVNSSRPRSSFQELKPLKIFQNIALFFLTVFLPAEDRKNAYKTILLVFLSHRSLNSIFVERVCEY